MELKTAILTAIQNKPYDLSPYRDLLDLSKAENCLLELRQAKKLLPKSSNENILLMLRNYIIRLGCESFAEYMEAIEIDRPIKETFWHRRKTILEGKHKIASTLTMFLDDPQYNRLILSAPAGTFKSAILAFLNAYTIGKGYKEKGAFIKSFYASYTSKTANDFFDNVVGIMTDERYAHSLIFPEQPQKKRNNLFIDNVEKSITFNSKDEKPSFAALSLESGITGWTRSNSLLICDDMIKGIEKARGEAVREVVNSVKGNVLSRTEGDNCKVVVGGTIWSVKDIVSTELKEHKDDLQCLKMIIPLFDDNGESNFDFGYSDIGYSTEKAIYLRDNQYKHSRTFFSCMYMCRPMEEEGVMFPYDQLNFIDNKDLSETEPNITAFVDVAFAKGGDYLSCPAIGEYDNGDIVVLDWYFSNKGRTETEPELCDFIIKNKIKSICFEADRGGDFYGENIKRLLTEKGYTINQTRRAAGSGKSKEGRIEQQSENIFKLKFLNQSTEMYKEAIDNVCEFSIERKPTHDDAPDSLAGWFAWRMKSARNKVILSERW